MSDEDRDYVLINADDARRTSEDSAYAPQPPHIRARIQKWLCPSEYAAESSDYNKHRRSYCPNTGQWLRHSTQYLTWHNSGESALWINGIPGSGKSVVAASLISDFLEHEQFPVLYFFSRYANLANRTPKQMTRDWLSQLLDHSTLLQSRLKDLIEQTSSRESVSFEDLWKCLCSAIVIFPKIYCVADALDEMESGNDWFLHRLVELGRLKPSTMKLVMTSRQAPHIEKIFREPMVLSINLDRTLIDQDIATYIHHLLSARPAVDVSEDQKTLIQTTVQRKANGLFIYARLMMDEILPNIDSPTFQALLEGLPSGIDGMYTTLLSEHSRRSGINHELQAMILQWITHATRPLRLLEVAELIRSASGEHGSIQETKNTVRSACGPLLTVLPDETLQVIHHSFTEFLVNTSRTSGYPPFVPEDVHTAAATTCIEYIVSCSLTKKATGAKYPKKFSMFDFKPRQRDSFFLEHFFLQYAVSNWMIHASKSRSSDRLLTTALDRLLAPLDDHFAFWLGIWHMSGQRKLRDVPQPLHVASFFGFNSYVAKACNGATDVNAKDSGGRTPLSYACDGGHHDLVRLLLDHGASALIASRFAVSPLHYACALNRPDIVKHLLEAKADPFLETQSPRDENRKVMDKAHYPELCNNRRRFGKSALQHACTQGYIECVQSMLESLAPDKRQLGPLHWAAKAGKAEVVELMLRMYNGDPNSYNDKGNTPLCLAARQHSPSTVQLLLDWGASPFMKSTGIDEYYRVPTPRYLRSKSDRNAVTALHAWALGCDSSRQGSSIADMTRTAELLIAAGCKVNARDTEGKTPLFYWIISSGPRCSAFLEVLLSRGADAAIEDNFGCTPLHLLKYNSAESHIRTLLGAGGDMNKPRSDDGRTPLMCTLSGWQGSKPADWSEYVAKYGVNPNAQDWEGRTVLHHVLSTEAWAVWNVESWLQAGANPTIVDKNGRHCLFSLTTYYNKVEEEARLFQVFIAAGLDVNSKDNEGYNIALKKSRYQDFDDLKRLERYGVDFSAKNHHGRTALHILAGREPPPSDPSVKARLQLLRFWIDHGVDVNTQDLSGDTMLHVGFSNPRLGDARLFFETALQVGAEPNIRNRRGRTIVHMAAGAALSTSWKHQNEEQALDLLLTPHLNLDVNLADLDGRTPLHLAATRSASRVYKLLCAGSNVNALDYQGRSVLHYAARASNSNILGLVLQTLQHDNAMSILHQQDCNGRTALHDAVRSGAPEAVQVLLDSSADPNMRDIKGKTALHTASEINEEQMWKSLRHSTAFEPSQGKKRWKLDFAKPEYKSQPGNLVLEDPLRPLQAQMEKFDRESDTDTTTCGITSRIRDVVRALLDAGADPSAKDVDGLDALTQALESNSKDVVYVMSSAVRPYGDVLNMTDHGNRLSKWKVQRWKREHAMTPLLAGDIATTPEEATAFLLQAITDGDEEMIEALLDLGADPAHADQEGSTALHRAVSNGLLMITRILFRRCNDPKAVPSNLFHKAARREECNIAMINQLIEIGCDTNAIEVSIEKSRYDRKENNLSVIHILATGEYWWQPMALDYLLKSGANTEAATSKGRTALQLAIRGRCNHYGGPGFWRKQTIATLLDHGAKVNLVDAEGKTPLIEAFEEGTDIVKTLIAHGADVNFGPTPPIAHAVQSGNVEIVEAMLQAGADANAIHDDPHTTRAPEPVLLQIARGNYGNRSTSSTQTRANAERIAELLIRAGADVGVVSEDGIPLFIAIVKDHGIILPFLSRGVDMEMRDAEGMTPFLAACVTKYPEEALQRMIQAGANPLAVDNSGKTALHHAASLKFGDHSEVADFLLSQNIPVDALDTTCRTALHYAVEKGQFMSPEMVRHLLEAGADAAIPFPDASSRSLLHILLPNLAEAGENYNEPPSTWRPLIERFVAAGLDKEARDSNGNTPIFGYVAKQPTYDDEYPQANRHPDLEEQRRDLQDYNIDTKNNAGEGLLHVVAKRRSDVGQMRDTKNMFKLLLELGLNPEDEDGSQRTPLDVAAACGNTGILDLFAPER
ncbi:MAG: hypothetical protein Q9226_002552 [Calogaya cf. arnoldii]